MQPLLGFLGIVLIALGQVGKGADAPPDCPQSQSAQLERMLAADDLLARGATRVYRNEFLSAISFPVGGIGAGCIQFNGKAQRHAWQIFNNIEAVELPHSFLAVRTQVAGGQPVVRALQTEALGPFAAMKSLCFRGEYPLGWYDFDDPQSPVCHLYTTLILPPGIIFKRHEICASAEGGTNLPKQHGAKSCAKELPKNYGGLIWETSD